LQEIFIDIVTAFTGLMESDFCMTDWPKIADPRCKYYACWSQKWLSLES